MTENLNLEYHYKDLSLKALNKATTVPKAADLLGIPKTTLYKWIKDFNITFDNYKYIIKNENSNV